MSNAKPWEDIADILTEAGIEKLKVGQLLRFDYEGSPVELLIKRKTRTKDGEPHVWAQRITTYHPDEVYITETDEDGHQETMNMGDML